MSRIFFCEVFFYFLMIQKTFEQIPNYQCTKGYHETWCYLSNVNQTSSMKHFKVISHRRDVSEVDRVDFLGSKIQILTEEVCEALPYVQVFYADSLNLTSVDDNAFKKCLKLTHVLLQGNSLTNLPSGVFDFNIELSYVRLDDNKLTEIDESIFKNNPNLRIIYLNNNKLRIFSFLSEMPALRWIYLDNNDLYEVDIETLLEKCPVLEEIGLDRNKFPCDRQLNITEALKANNIKYKIGNCTKTEVEHGTSNTVTIIISTVSPLALLILGLAVWWLVKKFWKRIEEPSAPVEEVNLEVRTDRSHNMILTPLGPDGDYYYGY